MVTTTLNSGKFSFFIKERSLPFLRENSKLFAQFVLTILFFGLGLWFIKHEQSEIHEVRRVLTESRILWLLAGILLTLIYIFFQGLMYVSSFNAIKCKVNIWTAIILFAKRNFISVFLPAGGVSSLAFFTADIEKKNITRSQIHFASSIYGFVGILSVVIVAIPAFVIALIKGNSINSEWYALAIVMLIIGLALFLYFSISGKGRIYKWLIKVVPFTEVFLEDIRNNKIERTHFYFTIFYSVIIEVIGIAQLYVAMVALQMQPSLFAATMGYIIAVVFMIVSPFLRGLGAIEVSLAFILTRFGYTNVESIAITLLYRFFEFWLPLLAGIISFLLKISKLLMRIIPAAFLLIMGIINIVSVVTPSIPERIQWLREFLLLETIDASNYLVLVAGLFLLITAAFMLKGLRSTWWFALGLSIISLFGHLLKALDYEEATLALVVIIILLFTRKEYHIKSNPKLRSVGIQSALISIFAVMLYGIIGFYLLDKKHFNIDFSLVQSIRFTILNYFLIGSNELLPNNSFARDFLYSINISGFITIAFLIFTLIRPYVVKDLSSPEEMIKAKDLLNKYGASALDYFKTYFDKLIFTTADINAFISYRVASNFAVVLENPIAENDSTMGECIISFDRYCNENGLKSIYYRVPENTLDIYNSLGKKSLFIGQEAIVDLVTFTLEGGPKKSLRNAVSKIRDRGYVSHIHKPPVMDGILQKAKSVSDDWLYSTDRKEIVFSQGMFNWEELKQQTIMTVENPEEKVAAFCNIIPDFTSGEATYDLIRKTADAPNGILDFLLVELFNYFRAENLKYVNLGFAPLSGLESPQNLPERSMKFAYEKIRSFSHYKGLHDFKEKFFPEWYNKYLIYNHDYDLLQVPGVLLKVMKP